MLGLPAVALFKLGRQEPYIKKEKATDKYFH